MTPSALRLFILASVYIWNVACTQLKPVVESGDGVSLVGNEFVVSVDCYVVRASLKYGTLLLSPGNAPYFGLPLPVDQIHVGHVFEGDMVIGIVSSGTVFRVESLQRLKSFEDDILMPYVRLIQPESNEQPLLNAYRLFDWNSDLLEIEPEFGKKIQTE